jgi:hypothetical protein
VCVCVCVCVCVRVCVCVDMRLGCAKRGFRRDLLHRQKRPINKRDLLCVKRGLRRTLASTNLLPTA